MVYKCLRRKELATADVDDEEFDILSYLDSEQLIAYMESIGHLDFDEFDIVCGTERTKARKLKEIQKVLLEHVKANCGCIL